MRETPNVIELRLTPKQIEALLTIDKDLEKAILTLVDSQVYAIQSIIRPTWSNVYKADKEWEDGW